MRHTENILVLLEYHMAVLQPNSYSPIRTHRLRRGQKIMIENECVLIWRSPIGSGVRPLGTPEVLNIFCDRANMITNFTS